VRFDEPTVSDGTLVNATITQEVVLPENTSDGDSAR
jgi:hypothetical protein